MRTGRCVLKCCECCVHQCAGLDFLTVLGAHEGEGLLLEENLLVAGSHNVADKGHKVRHDTHVPFMHTRRFVIALMHTRRFVIAFNAPPHVHPRRIGASSKWRSSS